MTTTIDSSQVRLGESTVSDLIGDGTDIIQYPSMIDGFPMLNIRAKLQETFNLAADGKASMDGTTDDTDAWLNTIEWFDSFGTQPKPILILPFGVSRITQKLSFSQRFLHIQGQGIGRAVGDLSNVTGGTSILYDGPNLLSTEGILEFNDGPTANRGVSVKDISILCEHKGNGIYAAGADMSEFERIYIDKPLTGVTFVSTCYSSLLSRIEIFDPRVGCFDIRNSSHAVALEKCRMNNLYAGGVVTTETPQFGIRIAQDGNSSSVKVDTCSFDLYNTTVHLRMVNACKGFTFINPYIECRGDGITQNAVIIQACEGLNISGGRITRSDSPTPTPIDYAIQLQSGVDGANISGIHFAGFDVSAIRVASGAKNYSISSCYTAGALPLLNDQNSSPQGTIMDELGVRGASPRTFSYTPILTNDINVTDSSASISMVTVIGDFVTVDGTISVTPTSAANTVVGISLPIPSNFTAGSNATGTATDSQTQSGRVSADATNDRLSLRFTANSTATRDWSFTVKYRILT